MRIFRLLCAALALLALVSCTSLIPPGTIKQTASIVDYLYPSTQDQPSATPSPARLALPLRVGIAFVPGTGQNALSETEKMQLLERVRDTFVQYDYIGPVELIPTTNLAPGGGFANLDQVTRMFNVDVIALLSFDQVQFKDSNKLSMLYWTVVGAFTVHGNQFDIQTMLETSVFDVRSRRLLWRAAGSSVIKGGASLAVFNEQARAAQATAYGQALDQMLPNLQHELGHFLQHIRNDPGYRLENRPGYKGSGILDSVLF